MFCKNCGTPLKDGMKFCINCGAPQAASQPQAMSQPQTADSPAAPYNPGELSTRVQLCPDGKYRWTYDLNLVKNPTVFIDLIKVFSVITFCFWLLMVSVSLIKSGHRYRLDEFLIGTKTILLVYAIMVFICIISYIVVIRINHGYYHLKFIMDEEGITYQQLESTTKKGERIAAAAVILDTDNAAAALAAIQYEWTARYPKVRSVKTRRRRHLIKVNEILTKNRIYVDNPEDYEFVLHYVRDRCPKVKKK